MSDPYRRDTDECPNAPFCHAHEYNTAELHKQKGYWKFVWTFAASFIASLLAFGAWQVQQTQAMREMVISVDRTVNALVQVSNTYHTEMERRINRNEQDIARWLYRGGVIDYDESQSN